MTIGEVIKFLKGVQPFQELDEETLQNLASGIILEFHPKGSIILQQDGPASDCLWIIRKGAVRVFVRSESGEEVDIDSRREGEAFGFLSLMSGDKSRANVVALADTTTYLVSRETMFRLLDTHPAFAEYFLLSIFNKYIDKSYKEMRKKSLLCSGGNNLLFTTPLSELITREVVTASQDISIRDAAGIMSRSRISCLVLLDSSGIPAGIVTDRDLRDKVTAKDRRVEDPVREIMSALLIRADAQEYGFEALLKMMRYNIHHLLVIDNGRLRGVVTNHDLMMLQGTSPISIVREIESQKTIEGLAPAAKKLNRIIELLTREGAKASNIVRIITEINDRLLKKILDITEEKLGPPPVSYCWIVYGSEGRKEQTIKTDQDNAIIYEDPRNKDEEDKANSYFTNFAVRMNEALMECGFPACPANYMASNPKWRQPLRTWKEYFSKWINHPTPEAILYSLIFFDFRPIGGNITLAQELR
ncbi:MAG TPA: DUF294 nucleotidyltransferase-like domain-containing protein, partial [Thermodesulfovibrionales bacterium]|nr:DUF294 nucleotidyltransferase-like domain-containing protein [Thermodesulfovibrionales bacterium]